MSNLFLILVIAICGGDGRPVDFDTEIMPVFTRYGCNAGACHGSAAGRGGFKLSLFGSRPELDHQTIVHQLQGRRINQASPERSLLLLKPTGELEHGGDHRFDLDSEAGMRILDWVKAGANRKSSRTVTRLEVAPSNAIIESPGQAVELKSVAVFEDGTKQDVTDWTVFEAEDKQSLKVNAETAIAKPTRRGRHIVIARFLNQVASVEIIVPFATESSPAKKLEVNFIDQAINEKLNTLRIPESGQASDAEFFRRVHVDLTGSLPNSDKVLAFLTDGSAAKRGQLVDELLKTDDFVDYWTYRFGQWLRVGAKNQDAQSSTAYYEWLRDQVKADRPLDQLVRTLILSFGDTYQVGPANFYRTSDNARLQAEFVSQSLMGVQLRCANCHDHPFDRWTQDDYHGLAAVFASVSKGRVISINAGGEVTNPRTSEPAIAKIPGSETEPDRQVDLEQLADWLTHQENDFFAKATVNRIWSNFFGRGLVDPMDDLRSTNPATHPELLKRLEKDFQENGFDFRHTIRLICNSAAYQRSSNAVSGNESDDRFYSRFPIRNLSPEVLADAISTSTDVPEKYANHAAGSKAIQLHRPGVRSEMLETLGKCTDEKTCEIGVELSGGISRQLQLINGDLLNRRISDSSGLLSQLVQSNQQNREIIDTLYLRCLSRKPLDDETAFWEEQLNATSGKSARIKLLEDLNWSLLTCREFITNH